MIISIPFPGALTDIYCVEFANFLATAALDTCGSINLIAFCFGAADGTYRALSCAQAALFAGIRIDFEFFQSLAASCWAMLVHHMLHIFIAEIL